MFRQVLGRRRWDGPRSSWDRRLGSGAVGRPRDHRIDEAVLAATRELLVEQGYVGLSVEAVARRAGTTKPTIYLRWPSKAHLVHDAVYPERPGPLVPDTGTFRGDLAGFVADNLASVSRPEVQAAGPGLQADVERHPELRDTVIAGLQDAVRREFATAVDRARTRGEVDADTDADIVFDAVVGAIAFHVSAHGRPRADFAAALVALVLRGLTP
jgi:AcrR family transcriptional regulator